MKVKLNDIVLLKDKRKGVIVNIYEENKAYEVEFKVEDDGEYPEYETETIKHEDILEVIN